MCHTPRSSNFEPEPHILAEFSVALPAIASLTPAEPACSCSPAIQRALMKILATLQRMVKKVIFETVVRSYVLIFFFIFSKVAEKVVRPYTVVQSFGAFLTT